MNLWIHPFLKSLLAEERIFGFMPFLKILAEERIFGFKPFTRILAEERLFIPFLRVLAESLDSCLFQGVLAHCEMQIASSRI